MSRYLPAFLALMFAPMTVLAIPAGTDEEILERIKPVGALCVEGQNCAGKLEDGGAAITSAPDPTLDGDEPEAEADAVATGRSGQEVYSRYCFACHDAAIAGAPLFGDATQWQPRIDKGIDALVQNSIVGIPPLMPPRGTCMDCSDDELRAVVIHMVDAAQ